MKTKQNFNYHTHTYRCGHASGKDEEYIQAAIQAGFTTLGFSEHLGYEGWDDAHERIAFKDNDAYLKSMYALKEKYKEQINLRVGFEFEYFDDMKEYLFEIKKKCDYMINGQHAIGRDNQYLHDHCSDEDVAIYAQQVCDAIKCGLTQYVAHPDYFMLGRKDFSLACAEAIKKIAQCAKQYKIPLELNLKGLRYGLQAFPQGERYIYPHREVWEIIAQYQCDVVFGYDAHIPNALLESQRQDEASRIVEGLDIHFLKELVL